jgi:aspartyl-tRNA synthetase
MQFLKIETTAHGCVSMVHKHDHGFLWIKNAPMYEQHTKEEMKDLKTYIFLMMYHCHQIHYKMHNNINACLYVRKK